METAIRIENLTKLYKGDRGIQDLNLDVKKGEIFGFLGPNGAGKTTAMKIMTGLLHQTSGEVYLNGHSIKDAYELAMKDVGCIIENVCLFPYLTAYENMKLCGRFYEDVNDERIEWALNETGMIEYKNEKVKNFSLGMRQRMGISLAILSMPKILILDEPLNGLDVEGMVEMRKLFKKLSTENETTIFISSHLIHDVELTCDRVGVVHHSRLIAQNSMENILKNFSTLENYYLSEVGPNV